MDAPPINPRSSRPRIAVIGGGISGLAAAHRLTELLPNAELALFEASPRLGGILDTVTIDGFLVERSADNFLTKLPAAVDLCRRLGIADELLPTDEWRRRALVVRDGRLMPIPDGFYLMAPRKLGPVLASRVLSMRGKLRLLAEPLVPRRSSHGDDQGSDESVASFARRRLGREVFERLVQPLVAGIYTADPDKLSMAATMPDFLAQERETGSLVKLLSPLRGGARGGADPADSAAGPRYALFAAPQAGLKRLVDALSARLPVGALHLNTAVVKVERRSDGAWLLHSGSEHPASSIQHPASFDGLIIAAPAYAASRLLHSADAELAAELAAIEYAGCAIVSLGFSRGQIRHALDAFGLVVPHVENRRIIAASFASRKFPGRAPADHVLIRVFIGGALQPTLVDRPDDELRQLALDELSSLLGITGEPVMVDLARWPRAMPQYHVGHLDRVARIEELAARHAGLALAGNAYRGVGIPQCIASGERAAEQIADRF